MNYVQATRQAIESQYDGICNIYEVIKKKNISTKIDESKEKLILKDKPCKLSFESLYQANTGDGKATILQIVKLFIAPEIQILPGSRIEVTQNKITENYTRSGKPAVYATHQEIKLELLKDWA